MLFSDKTPLALNVVNAPAPPLMLSAPTSMLPNPLVMLPLFKTPVPVMPEVPVRFVAVPLAGVPSAPPSYSNVEDALGSVKVFSLDAGPENFAKPFPVPP